MRFHRSRAASQSEFRGSAGPDSQPLLPLRGRDPVAVRPLLPLTSSPSS